MKKSTYTYIGPIHQLVTFTNLPVKGALSDDFLDVKTNQGILIKDDIIYEIGDHNTVLAKAKNCLATLHILTEKYTIVPGFIDSHTHICFAGSRARDYAMRNAGVSYLDIAKAGGGIIDTVTQTRQASLEQLSQLTASRANKLLQRGITTIEVKSGYGQTVAEELKMLRAIQNAQKLTQVTLIPTCLAAHIIPPEYKNDPTAYLKIVTEELLPQVKRENLANRVDAFIEEGAYSSEVIKPYFKKAQKLGFDITVHADQFSTGGSAIAIDFNAVSADHLEASGDQEVELLAQSHTVATALPGATLGLGCAFTPARKLLDAGATLAIASDWNPGSAPMGDLVTQAAILGTFQKLSTTEVLAGITCRAAKALNCNDRGVLDPGKKADFNLYKTHSVHDILYHQGQLRPYQVFKNGISIHSKK